MKTISAMAAALLVAAALASAAAAQERGRGIEVNGQQRQAGIKIDLELKARDRSTEREFRTVCSGGCDRAAPPMLTLGKEVVVCFQPNADGYVTVWSIDAKGQHDLIFPNKYSHPGKTRAVAVKANARTCEPGT